MFSIDLIKKKAFRGRKKNAVKVPTVQKKKSKSFLPLETASALFQEEHKEKKNNKADAGEKDTEIGTWRYYSRKLTQDVQPVINMDANFKFPTKRLKSSILKLHDTVDVVARQGKLKFKKKKIKSFSKDTQKRNFRKIGSCSTFEIKGNFKNENLDLLVADNQENKELNENFCFPDSVKDVLGEEEIIEKPFIIGKNISKKRKINMVKRKNEGSEPNVILDRSKKINAKLIIKEKNKKHKKTNRPTSNSTLCNDPDMDVNTDEGGIICELTGEEDGILRDINYPLKVVNVKNKAITTAISKKTVFKKNKISPIVTEKYSASIETDILTQSLGMKSDKNLIAELSSNVSKMSKLHYNALTLSEDALLVAFFPETEFYFSGNVWLKLIIGSICIHGYTFQPGDLYPIFSPSSHSLQSVNVLEGNKIKQFTLPALEDPDIPNDWMQQMNIDENLPVAIVKFCRYDNSSSRLLVASQLLHKSTSPITFDKLFQDKLGIQVVEQNLNTYGNCLKLESPAWNLYANSILQNSPNDSRIVIAGGKGVGKSTFFTYLINRLLSNHSVDHVACIDLDPGQPEFSLSSVLSITKISEPLLGPAHTRMNGKNFIDQTQIVLGDMSVSNVLQEYLSIVKRLEHIYKKKYYNMPLLINTMGFTSSIGLDIMVDVLRIFNPSHVLVIESSKPKLNYAYSLRSSFVNSYNGGILEKIPSKPLSYEFKCMKAFSSSAPKIQNIMLRDLRILSYLSKLWKDEELEFTGLNCKKVIKVPWFSIAIHVIGSDVPQEYLLDAINATLVALCKVEEEYLEGYLEGIESILPRQIKKNSLWHHTSTCLGWGVIQGIDPVTKELNILTPLNEEIMMLEVNALVLTKTCLPVYFSQLFSTSAGPYMKLKNFN